MRIGKTPHALNGTDTQVKPFVAKGGVVGYGHGEQEAQ